MVVAFLPWHGGASARASFLLVMVVAMLLDNGSTVVSFLWPKNTTLDQPTAGP